MHKDVPFSNILCMKLKNKRQIHHKKGFSCLIILLSYLLAIAGLLVFSSYGVQDGNNVGRTFCKIGCAGNWRLMDVHGVRILKDREAVRYIIMMCYIMMYAKLGRKGSYYEITKSKEMNVCSHFLRTC